MSIQNVQAFEAVCDGDECCRRHECMSREKGDLALIVRSDGWRATPQYGGGYRILCPECNQKDRAKQAAS